MHLAKRITLLLLFGCFSLHAKVLITDSTEALTNTQKQLILSSQALTQSKIHFHFSSSGDRQSTPPYVRFQFKNSVLVAIDASQEIEQFVHSTFSKGTREYFSHHFQWGGMQRLVLQLEGLSTLYPKGGFTFSWPIFLLACLAFAFYFTQNFRKKTLAGWPFVLLVVALWSCYHPGIFWDGSYLFPRDSYRSGYQAFAYISGFLGEYGVFPGWVFNDKGGMWIDVISNNYLTLSPTRILGYWVALNSDFATAAIFKWVVFYGSLAITLLGFYLLCKKILKSEGYAAIATLLAFLASTGSGLLHQEQDIATVMFLPFLWLSLFKAQNDPKYWYVFASLLGLSCLVHYPHLHLIYWSMIAALSALGRRFRVPRGKEKTRRLLICGCLFIISFGPSLYAFLEYRNEIKSDFRGQSSSIFTAKYSDYRALPAIAQSSAYPTDFSLSLFGPQQRLSEPRKYLDYSAFYFTAGVPLAILLTLFFFPNLLMLHGLAVAILAFLCCGLHSGAAQMLWNFVPALSMFRQWYHFHAFLGLHAILWVVYATKLIIDSPAPIRSAKLAVGASLLLVISLTGVVSPEFYLGGSLILLLNSLINAKRPRQALIYGWLILYSAFWSHQMLAEYSAWLRYVPSTMDTRYTQTLLSGGLPFFAVATPKGMGPIPSSAPLVIENGRTRTLRKHEWIANSDGKKYSISFTSNLNASALVLQQFNDGRWLSNAPIQQSMWNTLLFPLQGRTTIEFWRPQSPWQVLRILCFIPLLLSLGFCLKERRRVEWRLWLPNSVGFMRKRKHP